MAGFRGPLFLLGISSPSGQAGYRSVLPLPNLAGGAAEQAGYRSALPIPNLAGRATVQAGFRSPIPVLRLGAGATVVVEDVPLGGPSDGYLLAEEETIMLVARAFLTMVNQ